MTLDFAAAGLIVLLALAWLLLRNRRKKRESARRSAERKERFACDGTCDGCPILRDGDGACPGASRRDDEEG